MNDIFKQYELAKKKALKFMKKGQLNAYFNALNEMNEYETQLVLVLSN